MMDGAVWHVATWYIVLMKHYFFLCHVKHFFDNFLFQSGKTSSLPFFSLQQKISIRLSKYRDHIGRQMCFWWLSRSFAFSGVSIELKRVMMDSLVVHSAIQHKKSFLLQLNDSQQGQESVWPLPFFLTEPSCYNTFQADAKFANGILYGGEILMETWNSWHFSKSVISLSSRNY